jgi:hypothetical protein
VTQDSRFGHGFAEAGGSQFNNRWFEESLMVRKTALVLAVTLVFPAVTAMADGPAVFGDLQSMHPKKLSAPEVEKLLTGAKMSRKVRKTGSTNFWTNEPGGKFVISTDNRGGIGTTTLMHSSTYPGVWHISKDGRYCVTIEWKIIPTEKWCRYVFETSEGYYASNSDHDAAAKVYHLVVNGK